MPDQLILAPTCDSSGCPQLDSRELLAVSEEASCEDIYWFRSNSFSNVRTTDKDKFELRELAARNKVAPAVFSIPCKPGEPLSTSRGGYVSTIDFAYYNMHVTLDPCEVLEEIWFPEDCTPYDRLPYEEKYRRHVAELTALLRRSALTRQELMAALVKLHGSYTVEGPKMDPVNIDFERNPCLTVALKKTWDEPDSFPLDDIVEIRAMFKQFTKGKMVRRMTFGVDAWHAFYNTPVVRKEVISACECTEPGNNIVRASEVDCGVEFMGTIAGIPLYTDSRTFLDHDGQEEYIIPQDAILVEGEGFGGIRGHGRIMSPAANFEPGDLFFRQTFDDETECWKMSVQGSILMLPSNVNTAMLVRNVGRVMTYPNQGCTDLLLDSEGEIYAPPRQFSADENQLDEIAAAVAGTDYFEVCATIFGRTAPRIHCRDSEECLAGDICRITPTTDGCPDALQRVISKQDAYRQGIDDASLCNLVRFNAMRVIAMPTNEHQEAEMIITTPTSPFVSK